MTPILDKHIHLIDKCGPLISVVGASGVGKSILAQRIALMISRAESSPNVLLIDGDLYNRGITAQFENVIKPESCYLFDTIIGKNTELKPFDITSSLVSVKNEPALISEGRVYFLPSIHRQSKNPYVVVGSLDVRELQILLLEAISNAVKYCNARAVIIDTVSIPEPVVSVLAANSDILIAVTNKHIGYAIIDDHIDRLREFVYITDQAPMKKVYNNIENNLLSDMHISYDYLHHIPRLDGIQKGRSDIDAESIIDAIVFDKHVVEIIIKSLGSTYSDLIPPWYASFLTEWRNLAKVYLELKPKVFPLFFSKIFTSVAVGIPSLTCIIIATVQWEHKSRINLNAFNFGMGMIIGLLFLVISLFMSMKLISDIKTCYTADNYLLKKDADWVIKYLKLESEKADKTPQLKRKMHAIRKLNSLRYIFDTLWRGIIRNN